MRSSGKFATYFNNHSTFLTVIIIFLLHLTFLFNGFTWLDHKDIEKGAGVLPIHLLFPHAFLQPYADTYFYRPVVTILHSIDATLYGGFSPGFHLTNTLLFLAIVAATPFFLRSFFTLTKKQALLSMLIIGVHPLTWLPVGSISYRPELLMTLGTMLSFSYYVRARKDEGDKKSRLISLTLLFAFIALLAKETSLYLLPILIIFWEILYRRKQTVRTILPVILPLLGVFLLYTVLRLSAVPSLWERTLSTLTLNEAIATRLHVFSALIIHLINPLLPHLDDTTKIRTLTDPIPLITIGFLIILGIVIKRLTLRSQLSICLLLVLLSLVPSLNLIHLPRFYSPHYAFFAVIPFSFLIVLLSEKIPGRYHYVPVLLWILIAGSQTVVGGIRFANDYTLFAPEVRKAPLYKEGNLYLGNYYALQQQFPGAEKAYKTSLQSNSGVIAYDQPLPVLLNLTTVLLQEKKYAEAERYIGILEEKAPGSYQGEIRVRKAYLYSAQNKPNAAIKLLAPSVQSLSLEELTILANAYHAVGNQTKALQTLQMTLPLLSPEKRSEMEKFISSQTQN